MDDREFEPLELVLQPSPQSGLVAAPRGPVEDEEKFHASIS